MLIISRIKLYNLKSIELDVNPDINILLMITNLGKHDFIND